MVRSCLIVDDNPSFLASAGALLTDQGLCVVGAVSNGEEALACAAAHQPDVVLVDVDLGADSGVDLARALAAAQTEGAVILVSAYAEADLRELLEGTPAIGFLVKSALSRAAIENLVGSSPA